MNYRIVVTESAERDLTSACSWWAENRSLIQAARWYSGFAAAIVSLGQDAERCQRAQETMELPYELRQLNFGLGRRPTHRAIFTIQGDCVVILRIRHLAQQPLSPEDLETQGGE